MPVDERAVRIVLPRPDMQRVKGWQPEAVGSLEIMEQLAHELRRTAPMRCVPRVREHNRQHGEQKRIAHRRNAIEVQKQADRKSTRLNSSHLVISYAVFCLKKNTTKAFSIASISL